jgi:hypothetical protein
MQCGFLELLAITAYSLSNARHIGGQHSRMSLRDCSLHVVGAVVCVCVELCVVSCASRVCAVCDCVTVVL